MVKVMSLSYIKMPSLQRVIIFLDVFHFYIEA